MFYIFNKTYVRIPFLLVLLLFSSCEPTTEQYISQLSGNDPDVKVLAARKLGVEGNTAAIEPLIHALGDNHSGVRREAANSLGVIGNPKVVSPLLATANDQDPGVRSTVARALGKVGNSRVLETLEDMLTDKYEDVRTEAAYSLGIYAEDRSIAPLVSALTDVDKNVKLAVITSLGKISSDLVIEPLVGTLQVSLGNLRSKIKEILKGRGRIVADYLAARYENTDALARVRAVNLMGDIGLKISSLDLEKALDDTSAMVRSAAVKALVKIKAGDIEEKLLKVLKDRRWFVQKSAAIALSRVGTIDLQGIEECLQDPDAMVRKAASLSLSLMDSGEANGILEITLANRDLAVIAGAYPYLIRKGNPDFEPLLIQALAEYGDAEMAATFSVCENKNLIDAGEEWVQIHCLTVVPHRREPIRWGKAGDNYKLN